MLGATGGGPGAAYQRSLYNPYRTLYELEARPPGGGADEGAPLARLPGGQEQTFGDYLLTRGKQPSDIYGRGRELLSQLYSLGPTGRTERDLDFEVSYPEEGAGTGTTGTGLNMSNLRDLLGLGLRPFMGSAGASGLSRRIPREQEMYSEALSRNATSGGFLDYLRNKYNLGRFVG